MRPLVYIAGPYTTGDPVINTRRAWNAGATLYDLTGCAVLVPHLSLLAHAMEPRGIDWWYQFDLRQVEHCTAVYRLEGNSTGADGEVAHAEKLNIPVFHEDRNEWPALLHFVGGWQP